MSEHDPNAYPPGWPQAYPPPPAQPQQYPPPQQQPQAYPPPPGQPQAYPPQQQPQAYPPPPAQPQQYPQQQPQQAAYPQAYPPQPQAYPQATPGYPAQSYPPPQPGQAGHAGPWATPGAEVLASNSQIIPPPRRGRRVGLIAGAVTVGVVGVAAASAYAYSLIGGGGDQPEQHLPANTAFVLRVDLDPSLSQKVDALRFVSKFPSTPHDLDWNKADHDPRKWVYEQITKDTKDAPSWSEVSGWLGKRAAVAVTPSAGQDPIPLLAIQVTDEAKATATLSRIKSSAGSPLGVVAKDGWVLLSDTPEHAKSAQDAAASSPLSASESFKGDVGALGDQGIASLWFDNAATTKLVKSSGGGGLFGLNGVSGALANQSAAGQLMKGHGAVALRFSGANLELAGKLRGLDLPASMRDMPAAKLALPADSIMAFQLGGLGDALSKAWPQLAQQLATAGGSQSADELTKQVEQQTGLKLPADLRPLLGDQLGVSVAGVPGQTPTFGVRVESSSPDVQRVTDLLSKTLQDRGAGTITIRPFTGGYAIGSTAEEADALAKGGGLADTDGFKEAVPDADGASAIVFVDLEKAMALLPKDSMTSSSRQSVEALRAVGFSARVEGSDGESFALRLTTK